MGEPTLPRETREAVIRELYGQAEALGWESMTGRAKSAQYTRWVEDPTIGGELADYLTADDIRVWLKDGPLKEYTRALEGVGSHARFTRKRFPPPEAMVRDALGSAWSIVSGSINEKPMNCRVTDGSVRRYLCWGKSQSFRDLLWAAVGQAVASPERPVIVVAMRAEHIVTEDERGRQEAIAAHCRIDLRYVRRELEEREETVGHG